jgi:hypothetical protein
MPGTGTKAGGAIGLALVVIALAVGASVLFLAPTPVFSSSSATPTPTPSPSPPLLGGVPIDQHEDATGGSGDGSVTPFVTGAYYSQDRATVTVHTFVPKIQEADGTCTASIVNGSASETATGPASVDIAGTSCAPLEIPLDASTTGKLTVVVVYKSSTSTGQSKPAGVIEP